MKPQVAGRHVNNSILLQVFNRTDKRHRETDLEDEEADRSITKESQRQNGAVGSGGAIFIFLGPALQGNVD